jgi:hypothetical protein
MFHINLAEKTVKQQTQNPKNYKKRHKTSCSQVVHIINKLY